MAGGPGPVSGPRRGGGVGGRGERGVREGREPGNSTIKSTVPTVPHTTEEKNM